MPCALLNLIEYFESVFPFLDKRGQLFDYC